MAPRALARRLAAVPALLIVAACAAEGTQALPGSSPPGEAISVPDDVMRVLHIDVEGRAATPGDVVPTVRNAMNRAMSISVATAGGGRAVLAEGPGGDGRALRLPAHRSSGPAAAAVLVVRAVGRHDPLAPGRRNFRFGARFRLDETSAGTEADNGDNLLQRGVFADDAQYKLQIDGGVPSCLVRGADGEILATASQQVERRTWYAVTCTRTQDGVVLRLARLDGEGPRVRARKDGDTGLLRPERRVPMSIGGKLSGNGEVTTSSVDQFNGVVDDVFLEYPR